MDEDSPSPTQTGDARDESVNAQAHWHFTNDLQSAIATSQGSFTEGTLLATELSSSKSPSALRQPSFTAEPDNLRLANEEQRITMLSIEAWHELLCIQCLDVFYGNGSVDDNGYQILYRMCQIIWGVGHEVKIRKKVKLARHQRLAKFQ